MHPGVPAAPIRSHLGGDHVRDTIEQVAKAKVPFRLVKAVRSVHQEQNAMRSSAQSPKPAVVNLHKE